MIRRAWIKILGVALCVIVAASPAVAQTSTQTSSDTTDKMKSYSIEKKNEAVAYGKKMMSDMDVKIKELEAQMSRDASAAKADTQRGLNEMKEKRAQTAKKLDELGKASAQSWDATKQGFSDAYKDLQKSYDKAVASFKK
jgi:signal transduction protein with GAF and PtsI domain